MQQPIEIRRSTALGLVVALTMSCAAAGSERATGSVRLTTNVPEALLYVDDELYGTGESFAERTLDCPTGTREFRFEHPDYRREIVRILVTEDVTVSVDVNLRPRRAEENPGETSGGQESDE